MGDAGSEPEGSDRAWRALLGAAKAGLASLGLVGIVTLTGGAIAWTRFREAQLPADQAVGVMPRQDLLVLGAVSLTFFAVAGLAGVLLVYLLDRCGRPSTSNGAGLLVIAVIGLVWVLLLAGMRPLGAGVIGVVLAIIAALAVVAVRWRRVTPRMWRWEPGTDRRRLSFAGWATLIGLAAAAALVVLFFAGWWPALMVLVACALIAAGLEIARATRDEFRWYGVAVFFGVAAFGALTNALRTIDKPVLQAAAVLVKGGGPGGGIAGLYVAETDDRLYLGALERRCEMDRKGRLLGRVSPRPLPRSGRLFWVPRSEVEALTIGPLQGIAGALERAPQLLAELRARSELGNLPSRPEEAGGTPTQEAAATATANPGTLSGARTTPDGSRRFCAEPPAPPIERDISRPSTASAEDLARRFRPVLRFDSSERWRPLGIGELLAERYRDGRGHRLCAGVDEAAGCRPIFSADEFVVAWESTRKRGLQTYIDFHGEAPSEQRTPALAACPESGSLGLLDCDTGGRSAIYYSVLRANGRFYVDYWWFLRFNDWEKLEAFTTCRRKLVAVCSDHEGDWEGVTVVTDTEGRNLEYVSFAAHDGVFRYAPGQLRLQDRRRPVVYVAAGSHAGYPRPCRANCTQPIRHFGVNLPEGDHDGARPWGRNDDGACFTTRGGCLRPFPAPVPPLRANFNDYLGRWGRDCKGSRTCRLARGPASPAEQPRFKAPWCFRLPGARSLTCDVPTPGAPASAAPGVGTRADCRAWLGPDVAVLACDPAGVADDLGRTRGADSDASFAVRAGDARGGSEDTPGIAQAVRAPLRPGERVELATRGAAPRTLFVRGQASAGAPVLQARWDDLTLGARARAVVLVASSRGRVTFTLRGPDGRPVAPDEVDVLERPVPEERGRGRGS